MWAVIIDIANFNFWSVTVERKDLYTNPEINPTAIEPKVIIGFMVYPIIKQPTISAKPPTKAPAPQPKNIPAISMGRFSKLILIAPRVKDNCLPNTTLSAINSDSITIV